MESIAMTPFMRSPALALATSRGIFRVTVDGDATSPALILSNSLGTTLEMWDHQVAAFARNHRVIRYDTRGHGGSPVTPGPYTVEALGQDVLAVLDSLEIDTAAFCGISMGGHVGLWLGIHAGARFDAIAVCNSAARIGVAQTWNDRAATVRRGGSSALRALADAAPARWFTQAFASASPQIVTRVQEGLAGIEPEGYAACCDALASSDLRGTVDEIGVPTLLLAGEFDPVTTVADAQAMHAVMTHARMATVAASHLSNLEAPQAFEQTVLAFLASTAVCSQTRE